MIEINWDEAPEGCDSAMVADFNTDEISKGDVEFLTGGFFRTRDCYEEGPDAWIFVEKPKN